jgi:hypothetical protein
VCDVYGFQLIRKAVLPRICFVLLSIMLSSQVTRFCCALAVHQHPTDGRCVARTALLSAYGYLAFTGGYKTYTEFGLNDYSMNIQVRERCSFRA